jgi:hypothetical protein
MSKPEAKKTCFVVGPIGKEGSDVRTHSDWLYEGIIKPAFDGFAEFEKPIRADMIAQPGMITTQVIEHLLDDDLVIADLSLVNPNAFYEIGIRHMSQKPIVHMQLKGEAEPFDVSGFRSIKFALHHPTDLVEARRDLAAAIKVAVTSDHRVENPVTHARGAIRLEQSASPEQKVILEELRSFGERLAAVESRGSSLLNGPTVKTVSVLRISHGLMASDALEALRQGTLAALHSMGIFTSTTFRQRSDDVLDLEFDGALSSQTLEPIRKHISTHEGVLGTEMVLRRVRRS